MMISICMITYNHENYIAQAIESVLMQKTNFNIELVIGEDFSTDKTRKICQQYNNQHPGQIKLLLRNKNIGMMNNVVDTMQNCQGQYIAKLEGDDYWTDPYKLQKQVDFLEANPDYAISFTDYAQTVEDSQAFENKTNLCHKETLTIEDLIDNNYVSTLTCVFRNRLFNDYPENYKTLKVGDWPLHVLNAQYGKIKYHKGWTTGVYRVHSGGVWSGEDKLTKYLAYAEVYEFFKEVLPKKYHNQIINRMIGCYYSAASTLLERKDRKAAKEVIEKMGLQAGKLDLRYLKIKLKQIIG